MAMLEEFDQSGPEDPGPAVAEPLLYKGQRLDQPTFHTVYEQAGAREYVDFDVVAREFHWFVLREGGVEALPKDADGSYRSVAFPGLWVDESAFASNDGPAAMAALRRGLASADHGRFVEQLAANRANRP